MIRRYTLVLNVLFVIASLLLIDRIYGIWTSDDQPTTGSSGIKRGSSGINVPYVSQPNRVQRRAYNVITQKDLFRPERTEWASPTDESGQSASATPAKQLTVYGIIVAQKRRKRGFLKKVNRARQKKWPRVICSTTGG
ncbi:MAG TPA: hypothetical protein PLG17_04890 [Thermodesulfobacteriota bacterium]|nr:hypothetical protein [Thermodesulfobacteriota bacterium]